MKMSYFMYIMRNYISLDHACCTKISRRLHASNNWGRKSIIALKCVEKVIHPLDKCSSTTTLSQPATYIYGGGIETSPSINFATFLLSWRCSQRDDYAPLVNDHSSGTCSTFLVQVLCIKLIFISDSDRQTTNTRTNAEYTQNPVRSKLTIPL